MELAFTRQQAQHELANIASWWLNRSIDEHHQGFVGEIDFHGEVVPQADKGIVQNSRILWFFSEAALAATDILEQENYQQAATNAFDYIVKYFNDPQDGGAFWQLDHQGQVINDKKQTYAQSFCIYAFCAYYQLTDNKQALSLALDYFRLLEQHAKDSSNGGYIEAYSRQWQVIDDVRLSEKDLNAPKSMNTHLHVLEAYSALYKVAPTTETKQALRYIIELFADKIIDKASFHLRLFFDLQWQDLSKTYSYGHDIEASWLLWEALEILGDEALTQQLKPSVLGLAEVCLAEGIGEHGQVGDEICLSSQHQEMTSSWWIQAEALVGFLNAYQLTTDEKYWHACQVIWAFIDRYHLDKVHGEWHWLSSLDHHSDNFYKAGFWKAPYHNGRAMMEVCRLFTLIEANAIDVKTQYSNNNEQGENCGEVDYETS